MYKSYIDVKMPVASNGAGIFIFRKKMVYKKENHDRYSINDGAKDYDSYAGYDKPDSHIHTLGHLMGPGLTNPKHFMDFEEAKKHLPMGEKQISGYESEHVATLYKMFLDYYPNKFPALLYGVPKEESVFDDKHKDRFLSYLKDYVIMSNNDVIHSFRKKINNGEISADTPHKKGHLDYVTKYETAKDIPYPSDDEMKFHFDKAKEFCESFHEKHGQYPYERIKNAYDKQGNLQKPFHSMPLKEFEIENYYINEESSKNNGMSR